MTSCTYRFKNASGEEVTITGQAEMKAFLADGGLEQLLPGKVLPWGRAEGENADNSVAVSAKQSTSKAAGKPFVLSDLDALQSSLQDGSATVEQYQSAWQAFKQNQDAIKAELTKKTKPQLLDKVGGMLAYRLKGENKPEIVKAVFEAARNIFLLSREYGPTSYYMGEHQKYQEAKDKAFVDMVEATTAEDLKAYADKVAEADTERRQALDEFEKAIEDPQTLDDFRKYVTAKLRQGMSESEVRMSLTPEQRARMDELHAEYARKSRASRPAPAVTAASVTTGGDIVATKHTKTGEDLYVVRPAERVERDQYNIWNATAKRMGGWYSSFRGNGAVPGFQFKTRESADAFLAYVGGDTEGAKQVAQERRDAFADDRSQSAVERLTEMADRLEDRADESLSRDRKANTARRASMAASAEASASADKAMARTMRNIANAIKDGKAKFLDKVRQKVQVEMLRSFVSDAKYKHLTARYPSYVDFERNRHEPATAETADYATFPKYTADRADLARMGRELELIDGAKKLGQQLLKVADDATDEYLKFVKENLNKVSTFRAGGGGPAIFSSRDDAERAIARSGFRGKAIVYAVKRGQNMVVMGPSMAKENGLWTADASKRITLTDEAGEEITAKIESLNRNRERVYLPHQFSTTRERRAKLKAMGIETSAEFRAALREFIALSEAPTRPSKVKELERSMVGRKNDGLDFFPTPAGIAQQMIEAAEIKEGMRVLEPSAGMGHIAEQIRESGVDPDVVEFSSSRRELLEAKGFNVVANDFMEASGEYDRIIMNPPFSDRRDAQHVQHAYGLLKPGGRLVAIMGEGVFFGQDKKATEFREWLDSVGGTSEKLPDGSFLDSSLPVNTGVNARMVVIEKAEDAPAALRTDAETDESAVSRDAAESFVRQFVEEYPSAPEIILAENFSQLPADVQRDAIAQGSGPFKAKGAMKNGKIYVLRRNHHSMADMEATVFHEVLGHAGTRKLLGPKFSQELNKLFIGLGGYSGLEKIMAARGMSAQFHGYMDGVRQAKERNPDLWTDALAATVMTEEVFAHIAEQKGGQALRDRLMALVGMVRDWLRNHGFAELASLGESDILFMLQRARAGMREPSGIVRNGVRIAGGEVLAENGQVISVEGDRDFNALKVLAGRLGLTVENGPTAFRVEHADDQDFSDTSRMDDANNVAGKQAPTTSDTPDGAPALLRTINTASGRKTVRDHVAEAYSNVTGESAKTFNWWQRTVGSQYGKAKSDKDFGRVYDAAHAFLDGVSAFAKEASERASGILPHLDTWRDVAAGANVRKQWADSQDYQAIAPAIFDGTLANGTTGKVWTDDQLRDKYDLNDKQIGHYREFRAAVDFSLETLAASEMARLARASKMDVADRDMGMPDALAFYTDQLQGKIDAVQQAREEMDLRHSVERENMADLLSNVPNEKTRAESMRVMEERQAEESAKLDKATKQLEDLLGSFNDKARQIRKLQSEGYAPLMRFGQYTVDVVKLDDEGQPMQDEDGNPDRPFFGMFESEAEARKAEKILAEEYPGYTVTRGVLSTEANQLYRGLTPETAEMFARLLGTDENEAFQAYLKQAVANRSAMKRLINRMGVEGFATDVPRVLSAFITSNARLSSGNWYFGEMSKAVEAIPKHKGDVKTEAVRLMQYVQNPVEEAAGLRGFLFFSFLGGSIASALVNLTQTFTTTLPYLSQFGASDVAKALPKAMALSGKMMKKGIDAVSDKDLKDALRKASDEGVVDPQEIHLLMAEAGGNGASVGLSGLAGAMNKEWATPAARVTRSLSQAWGMLFGAAEKYNRHVAFIAAWEVAPKGVDRYEFAKNAVTETQFDYTKASRPNWARGAVGATLFTFKTFSINYVEFMSRLPSRERAIALGVLFLLAGMSGMPGGDDLDDVVDTVAQKMGYNWNNAAARHAWLVRVLGVGGADFVERGISSMLPLDVSARLGMGNLIPGTAVLQKSNASPARDVQEFFGPAGSVVAGFREVFDNAGGGKSLMETASPIAPKMLKDLRQAVDMVQTGQYRDTKGRKVVDVDGVDALLKGIGFQPNAVAEPRRIERMLAQSSGMQRIIRQDISELWARGVAEQDAQKIESARSILREWNEKNPDSRIVMNPTSIAQRVRAMRLTSAERLVKATPKDMRNALAAEMAIQQ